MNILTWENLWDLNQFFLKKHHTSSCGAAVARPAMSRKVAGSNPVVGVDRSGLSPNGLDGRALSFGFLIFIFEIKKIVADKISIGPELDFDQ